MISSKNEALLSQTRILLIEDSSEFAHFVKLTVESEKFTSFQVETVSSLHGAVKILGQESFDLVLMDLNLPDSRGIETFTAVHKAAKDIPVVVLSGMDNEELALTAVKKGAQDYIVKGEINRKILIRILRYAIERHRQHKEVNQLNERLEKLSFLDPLTELLNRRGLQSVLSRELKIFNREGNNLVVILMDLDNFKQINDAFGHAVGDIVLKEVSKVLKHTARSTDYISRIGGDEFMILLPHTRPVEAAHFSERIRLSINRTPIVLVGGEIIRATASLGVVNVIKRQPSIDELLEETHGALARSKRLGKNCVSFGNKDDRHAGDITEVLKGGKCFYAVKQPIWNLNENKLVGYEFLTRTNIPGFEMPDEFFNFSRERNLLSVVDHRCLEVSMAASFAVPAGCEKHINLLPSTMADLQTEHLNRLFPPTSLAGPYFIEISEQQILGDPSYLVPVVNEFKKRNIHIAIDDVGFGRSCLESLLLLQPETIKIDKKLIRGVSQDKHKSDLLKRLLAVTESLRIKVVAEGIENREDLKILQDLGVPAGQGFLWGRPA